MNPLGFLRNVIFAGLLLALVGCTGKEKLAGTSTESGNAFTVSGLVTEDGGAAIGAVATLYPVDFNPSIDLVANTMRAVADGQGKFNFKISVEGLYNIQIFHPEKQLTAIHQGIDLNNDNPDAFIPDLELREPGSFTVYLENLNITERNTLYIPGTGLKKEIGSEEIEQGYVTINQIPEGTYKAVNLSSSTNDEGTNILADPLIIQAKLAELAGPFEEWPDTLNITINTSPTGADVAQDVTSHPLLVRLGPSFPFSSSQPDGSDLRFSRDGIQPLPYEIEKWDSDSEEAIIWVLVDSIFGNNSSQKIMMFAGLGEAMGENSGTGVFREYFGTWHLHEDPTVPQPQFMDASGNENHAGSWRTNRQASHSVEGAIGTALNFTSPSQFLTTPLMTTNPQVFTVSLWFKTDSGGGHLMAFTDTTGAVDRNIYMGDDGSLYFGVFPKAPDSIPQEDSVFLNTGPGVDSIFPGIQRILSAEGPLNDGEWHSVTAGLSPQGQVLYVDGVEVARNEAVTSGANFTGFWQMGQHNNNNWIGGSQRDWYLGTLDEVRVRYRAPDPARIKLEYENQKGGSTVVTIE